MWKWHPRALDFVERSPVLHAKSSPSEVPGTLALSVADDSDEVRYECCRSYGRKVPRQRLTRRGSALPASTSRYGRLSRDQRGTRVGGELQRRVKSVLCALSCIYRTATRCCVYVEDEDKGTHNGHVLDIRLCAVKRRRVLAAGSFADKK